METVVVTAEAFGYGPIVTCLNIVKEMVKNVQFKPIFIGSGIALEQALRSNLFSAYVKCETFSEQALNDCEIFRNANWVISVENEKGAVLAVQKSKHVFYIDNLFWMWKSIPYELTQVDKYYIVDFFGVEENIARIGKYIQNREVVGPLRVFDKEVKRNLDNRILINLGGAESYMTDFDIVAKFYTSIIELIVENAKNLSVSEIVICGGSNIVKVLSTTISEPNIKCMSLENSKYLDILKSSKYLILSPGLGNFYEIMNTDREVFMLPPINYSQYLQLSYYKSEKLGIQCLNWDSFDWYCEVKSFLAEREGIEAVKQNIFCFIKDELAQQKLNDNIMSYLKNATDDWHEIRKHYMNKYSKNAVKNVATSLVRSIYG